MRELCILNKDLDILGIVETHLRNNDIINVDGYIWFGKNRHTLHPKAKKGSGGVGFLVKKDLMFNFNISVLDDTTEGILWLQCKCKVSDISMCICVCYLPPSGTSREVDSNAFFDTLMTQVYTYQKLGMFYICGDVNSRIADEADYIPGVDNIPERIVLDFTRNQYCEAFIDFLINVNCCVLNGRNVKRDFYTYRNVSVVDYCFVPYDNLELYQNFEVTPSSEMFDQFCLGICDPLHNIPDHNLLSWTLDISDMFNISSQENVPNEVHECIKYNLKNIPTNFGTGIRKLDVLREAYEHLIGLELMEGELNSLYDKFCTVIKEEMKLKLNPKTYRLSSGINSNKKRHCKKPWWTDELSHLWNVQCEAEGKWRGLRGASRAPAKAIWKKARCRFDKKYKLAKRLYWQKMQADILSQQRNDQQQFWKTFGRIGVGNERKKDIPWEIYNDDQTVVSDKASVLKGWQDHFSNLFNVKNKKNVYPVMNFGSNEKECNRQFENRLLDRDISLEEVAFALRKAKKGKAVGVDEIPTEVLGNQPVLETLHKLFQVCFSQGSVPDLWGKGIIHPIPKNNTADPRSPTNYRGITLAPAVYKLYCSVLNARMSDWSE